jgi:hypothetical protein
MLSLSGDEKPASAGEGERGGYLSSGIVRGRRLPFDREGGVERISKVTQEVSEDVVQASSSLATA